MSRRAFRPFLACQAALAAGLLGLLALTPPARGPILILSLSGDAGAPVRVALAHGARLLGPGPLPGSMVVVGERAALSPAARDAGLLLLAAPFAGCGEGPEVRA